MIKSAQSSRRYFARPILVIIALVFFWQVGAIPRALRAIATSRGAGDRAAEQERRRKQMEKIRLTLKTTEAILDAVEREQARREVEQAKKRNR